MNLPDPTFPPLFTGHGVRAPDQPLSAALTGVADATLGAGDIVWAHRTNVADLAIILEPEVPIEQALQMVPVAMLAAGDCIGALTPPQVGLMFDWPGTIVVNGGEAGKIQAVASTRTSGEVPDWMIVHLHLRLKRDDGREPGETPDQTALDEEGCEDLTRTEFIESYSRHFLTWLNTWTSEGFNAVHSGWLYRARGLNEEISLQIGKDAVKGTFMGLDEDGNLLLKSADGTITVATLRDTALQTPDEIVS